MPGFSLSLFLSVLLTFPVAVMKFPIPHNLTEKGFVLFHRLKAQFITVGVSWQLKMVIMNPQSSARKEWLPVLGSLSPFSQDLSLGNGATFSE